MQHNAILGEPNFTLLPTKLSCAPIQFKLMVSSGGKVQFSSVQRTISLNLELNSRFGSGHSAEP